MTEGNDRNSNAAALVVPLVVLCLSTSCDDADNGSGGASAADDEQAAENETETSSGEASGEGSGEEVEGGDEDGSCNLAQSVPRDVDCNDCSFSELGKLQVTIWGHDYVDQGIPASDMADGWAVNFSSFMVHVSAVTAKRFRCTNEYLEDPNGYVVDLASNIGERRAEVSLSRENVAEGRYNNIGFTIGPASPTARAKGVSDENYKLMAENGYAMYIAGTATKGDTTKTFAWGLRSSRPYAGCGGSIDVSPTQEGKTTISIHAEHLFYTSTSPEVGIFYFDWLATADANGDDIISESELRAVSVSEAGVEVGNKKIENLWGWLEYQSLSLGHLDDVIHCGKTEEHAVLGD